MLVNNLVRSMLLAISAAFLLPASARAADQPAEASSPGPAAKEFQQCHDQLNAVLADLAQLQIKYATASEEKKQEIQQKWKDLVAKGEAIEPKLVEAAQKAYTEAPNKDKKVAEFLMLLLGQRVKRDQYESAAQIGKLLMDNGCTDPRVANAAAVAAFAVSDFDTAEKYFQIADKSGYYEKALQNDKDKLAQAGWIHKQNVADYKKIWDKEKSIRERETEADTLPRVLLKTTKGDIELELFENQAPNTVANFISLVEKGFYRDVPFHRVIAGFMAQGGDPKGSGTGGPGYRIPCECYQPDYRRHFRGSLSMAHAGRDTGGSQFFLTFLPTAHLDGKHTAFGRVVQGMDVLAKLQRRDPEDPEALRPDKIIDAKVLRKRSHPYEPKTLPE